MESLNNSNCNKVVAASKFLSMLKFEFKIIFAIEPIMINIIALVICGGILLALNSQLIPGLGKWHHYIFHGAQLLAAYQVIKSANKSFTLPFFTIVVGLVGIYGHQYFPHIVEHAEIYKAIMLFGILGAARSVWNMH